LAYDAVQFVTIFSEQPAAFIPILHKDEDTKFL